ncbi:TIGR03915 family putative DNA repair protein [Maribacter sp. 2307ULW6-5]|uniref:TIGR03915 family putative DNA repair protein n=1 Tax=Maribacter sp. 2307ULW6-5 TaxID=3386275 RepID=UPI0039BC9424
MIQSMEAANTLFSGEHGTKTLVYDGSFNGFLTAVFVGYEQKLVHADIQAGRNVQRGLFTETETVFTNIEIAKRVWSGIQAKSSEAIKNIYFAFLSEQTGMEPLLYRYIRKVMGSTADRTADLGDDAILKIRQWSQKVSREKHRMEAFVRFQLTKDNIYFAQIEPDYDVLPLLSKHFRSRFADQEWIIYDAARNYGLYYNRSSVEIIGLDLQEDFSNRIKRNGTLADVEHDYQELWRQYFKSTHIKARINKKLHQQHVPKRYWKYLSEKKVG